MKLQSMYVDMRPLLLKWLGLLVLGVVVWVFLGSVQGDFDVALRRLQRAYQAMPKSGGFDLGFWDYCLRTTECQRQLLPRWTAQVEVKALVFGGGVFGLLCAFFGLLWRPEVAAMRDTRVNAARVEESRVKSPVPPRREL